MPLVPYAGKEKTKARYRPRGYYERSPNPRIMTTYPQELFDAVLAYAQERDMSYSAAVREIVAKGLGITNRGGIVND